MISSVCNGRLHCFKLSRRDVHVLVGGPIRAVQSIINHAVDQSYRCPPLHKVHSAHLLFAFITHKTLGQIQSPQTMHHALLKQSSLAPPADKSSSTTALLEANMRSNSVSTSASESKRASDLYDLDENSTKHILVYKLRSYATGLEMMTERKLCAQLDNGKCVTEGK